MNRKLAEMFFIGLLTIKYPFANFYGQRPVELGLFVNEPISAHLEYQSITYVVVGEYYGSEHSLLVPLNDSFKMGFGYGAAFFDSSQSRPSSHSLRFIFETKLWK